MDIASFEFLYALAAIVVIDLVLAGDNAIVIALAARNLPKHLQRRAIVWGTVGAIVVRTAMTVIVVQLLKIPGLLLAGGLLLLWIAYKLLHAGGGEGNAHDDVKGSDSLWGALRTVVIADAVMGLDNVLAVAGAAHGSILLVVMGLLISVPIVIFGSTFILKVIERYPAFIYVGAAVLVVTAVKMITAEPLLASTLDGEPALVALLYGVALVATLGVAFLRNHRRIESRIAARATRWNDRPAAGLTADFAVARLVIGMPVGMAISLAVAASLRFSNPSGPAYSAKRVPKLSNSGGSSARQMKIAPATRRSATGRRPCWRLSNPSCIRPAASSEPSRS